MASFMVNRILWRTVSRFFLFLFLLCLRMKKRKRIFISEMIIFSFFGGEGGGLGESGGYSKVFPSGVPVMFANFLELLNCSKSFPLINNY